MKFSILTINTFLAAALLASQSQADTFVSVMRCTAVGLAGNSTARHLIAGSESISNEEGKLEILKKKFIVDGVSRRMIIVKFTAADGKVISGRLSVVDGAKAVTLVENCNTESDIRNLNLSISS